MVQDRDAQMIKYLRGRAKLNNTSVCARLDNMELGPYGLSDFQIWQVLCEAEAPLTVKGGESAKENLVSMQVGYS